MVPKAKPVESVLLGSFAESWLPGSVSAASGEGACCKVLSGKHDLADLNRGA